MIAELEGLLATGHAISAFIVDDNLIGNKKAIKPVLREVIAWQQANGYPLTFFTEASIDLADDPELMRSDGRCQLISVFVGIESPNEASSARDQEVPECPHRGGTMLEKVHRIQEAGMEVWCGMIVGFDNDDETIFDAQRRFHRGGADRAMSMVGMLPAIPKTPLLRPARASEGRLDTAVIPPISGPSAPMSFRNASAATRCVKAMSR